jgi:hypothetical protein
MILLSATSLEAMCAALALKYGTDDLVIADAPGDSHRWFVVKDGLVMSGLHIVKRNSTYVFTLI